LTSTEILINGNASALTKRELAERKAAEATAPKLDDIDAAELARVDALIASTMVECGRGSVGADGRSNPAFRPSTR
jgi:hypothetical protein